MTTSPVTNFPNGIQVGGVPIFGTGDLITPGKTLWVDGTYGNDNYDGSAKDRAKKTIAGAIAASTASAGDVILLMPGTYTLTAALVPKAYTLFRAALIRPYPTVTITGSIATFVTAEASGVVFDGIRWLAAHNDVTQFILVADTADVYGLGVYRCLFDPNGKSSVTAIAAVDATYGIKHSDIIGNKFVGAADPAQIRIGAKGMEGCRILANLIAVADAVTGIDLADTGAITVGAWAEIAYNVFVGADVTPDDLAITIAGTENTTALVSIHDNRSIYLAANAATQDKISLGLVNNYGGDAATGGTLWDPGT